MIFSGANERAVIAVCRFLCPLDLPPIIIARSEQDPIWHTDYAHLIRASRQHDQLDLEDLVSCVRQVASVSDEVLILLPTVESVNRLILANRAEFELAGLNVELVPEAIYSQVSDKAKFIRLITSFGMSAPPEVPNPAAADLPIVAKPFAEFSSIDGAKCYPELIFSAAHLDRFLQTARAEDYFYQRYLAGDSYYYLMHLSADGTHRVAYQQNLLQQANGKSMLAARLCDCPDEALGDRLVAALRSVNYCGFVMVEILYAEGDFYVIEANPRLWGPFDLACRTAVASALLENLDAQASIRLSTEIMSRSGYTWLGGLVSEVMLGRKLRVYPNALRFLAAELLSRRCRDVFLRSDTRKLFFREIKTAISARKQRRAASEVM